MTRRALQIAGTVMLSFGGCDRAAAGPRAGTTGPGTLETSSGAEPAPTTLPDSTAADDEDDDDDDDPNPNPDDDLDDDLDTGGSSTTRPAVQPEASTGTSTSGGSTEAVDGTAASTGTGSETGGSHLQPGDPLPLLAQSDEFDDPEASAARWRFRHHAEEERPQFHIFSFGTSERDEAVMEPRFGGWFGGEKGPLVFQTMDGDFMVESYVEAHRRSDPSAGPQQPYNSVGLLIRDPASMPGSEHWILHHLGMHDPSTSGVGVERKITVGSTSTLVLTPGEFRGRIRICRVGQQVTLTRMLVGDDAFVETGSYDDAVGSTVQVGMSATVWNTVRQEPDFDRDGDVIGRWDYVRFWAITDPAQCFEDVPRVLESP